MTTEKRSRSGATPDSIRRLGILSAIFLIAVVVVTLVSLPWTFGHEVIEGQTSTARRFEATNPELALQPPSFAGESPYLLGSDHLGRDLLSRVLAGGGISLIVGLAAASTAVLLGGLWGMVAATSSPRVDGFMMRIVDVLYGLPYILIVVLLVVAVEGLLERTGVVLGSAVPLLGEHGGPGHEVGADVQRDEAMAGGKLRPGRKRLVKEFHTRLDAHSELSRSSSP